MRQSVPSRRTTQAAAPDRLRRMIRAHVAVVTGSQKDAAVFLHEWRFLIESAARPSPFAATSTRPCSAT